MTPLHVAAERGGRSKIVEYLVKKADINIEDHNGVNVQTNSSQSHASAWERALYY